MFNRGRQAKCKTSNPDRVQAIYQEARQLRNLGVDVQVDHVVPLSKGGLHEPWNLQIIDRITNLRKGNRIIILTYYLTR